jgi:hypothetical protein
MFGLGLLLIGFGMAGIGGMGAYYLLDIKNRADSSIKADRVNNAVDKIEQFLMNYEAIETAKQKEIKEFHEEEQEESIEETDRNIINLFEQFENREVES